MGLQEALSSKFIAICVVCWDGECCVRLSTLLCANNLLCRVRLKTCLKNYNRIRSWLFGIGHFIFIISDYYLSKYVAMSHIVIPTMDLSKQ